MYQVGVKPNNISYVKATALQATEYAYDDFNAIPLQRLNSLYGAFCQMQKDVKNMGSLDLDKPLDELQHRLNEAVADENYEVAQLIKERIDLLKG